MNLEKKLDRVLSEYIRLRDTDENYFGKCITCNQTIHYDDADNGHWHRRGKRSLRYFELNQHLQCRPCNRPPGMGMFEKYTEVMIERHGQPWVDQMIIYSNRMAKFPNYWYQPIIDYYTRANKQIRDLKRIGVQLPKELLEASIDDYSQFFI